MLLEISFDMIRRGVFENPSWDWGNTFVLTLAGFFIVFLLLLILIIIFTVFGKIMAKLNAKEAAKQQAEQKAEPAPASGGEVDDETKWKCNHGHCIYCSTGTATCLGDWSKCSCT